GLGLLRESRKYALGYFDAARSVEGECIVEGGGELVLELATQLPARAMEAGLCRFRLGFEVGCPLLAAPPFRLAKDEHGAKRGRQGVDCAFDQSADLGSRRTPFRVGRRGSGEEGHERNLSPVFRVVNDRQGDLRPLPAHAIEGFVEDDAGEPGREPGVAAKAVEIAEGADVSLLYDVLGLGLVADDAAGDAIEPAVMPLNHDSEGGVVATAHSGNKVGVGSLGEAG